MKAITLRSGRELPPKVLTKDGEKQGGEVAINIDDTTRKMGFISGRKTLSNDTIAVLETLYHRPS